MSRDQYRENPDYYKQKAKEWKKNNPKVVKLSRKKQWLKATYGLSWENFLKMYEAQDKQCAICKIDLPLFDENRNKQPFVDHCHKTGNVRGILCHHCNMGIGNFHEKVALLHAAEDYLNAFNS